LPTSLYSGSGPAI